MNTIKRQRRRIPKANLAPLQSEKIEGAIQTFWLCYEGKGHMLWPDEVMDLTMYIMHVLQGKR